MAGKKTDYEAQARIFAWMMANAVGKPNAKKMKQILASAHAEGIDCGEKQARTWLQNNDAVGFVDSRNGGYFIITSKAEADEVQLSLLKRAETLLNKADALAKRYK